MNKKLYVGNLDYSVTDDQLSQLFGQAGAVVSSTVITDRNTGRSKGFGFIEMSSDEEAKKAIEMLNGKDLQGRNLVVNEARPRVERPNQGQDFQK
ncbi:MAG TPA: RNA-binding protein [Candidatus Bathyarchaeia archaeon]|nr:RNA-binding protein [Candidatus Bathyarchaeia archaeon]